MMTQQPTLGGATRGRAGVQVRAGVLRWHHPDSTPHPPLLRQLWAASKDLGRALGRGCLAACDHCW